MTEPTKQTGSAASREARARLNDSQGARQLIDPPYDPLDPINRAKRGSAESLARPTDNANPRGVATVNGQEGLDSADTITRATVPNVVSASALPDTLTAAARASLEAAGIMNVADSAGKTDAELIALPDVGEKTVGILREAARAAGLSIAGEEGGA